MVSFLAAHAKKETRQTVLLTVSTRLKTNQVLNSKTREAFPLCFHSEQGGPLNTQICQWNPCFHILAEPILLNLGSIPLGKKSTGQEVDWARNVSMRLISSGHLVLYEAPIIIMKSLTVHIPKQRLPWSHQLGTQGLQKVHRRCQVQGWKVHGKR